MLSGGTTTTRRRRRRQNVQGTSLLGKSEIGFISKIHLPEIYYDE